MEKVEDVDEVYDSMPTHNTLIKGLLRPDRLVDIISNFIMWSGENKILPQYHQYFGVKKAIESTKKAFQNKTGKAGIVWHTQGSGKSFSMVFYAGNMIKRLNNPSIIVVTDRNDLDDQLFKTFLNCDTFLKQKPVHIESRSDLTEKLEGRKSGGIFFTTLQKFEEETGLFSNRDDILVLVDEAHRSHYGLEATIKIDKETLKAYKKYGTAKYLHEAFPNATYIGFTGTPIETKDKSTKAIFGDIIDTYDMTQSIMDNSTLKIMYESRMARVGLNQKLLNEIDEYYKELETDEDVEDYKLEQSKAQMANVGKIIEDPDRLQLIVQDIIEHYKTIQDSVANKAMVVAYSRNSAYTMYKKFLEIKPNWKNKIHMIITPSNKDSEEMQKAIGTKSDKARLETEFKDPNSEFKIAIVVDMWLTGFDVPCLGTMYIDKPMKSYNLMQAIARVNRVYKNKQGGLIIDYIGLKKWLIEALETYTKRDRSKIVDNSEIEKVLLDKLELIRDMFNGFYYGHFATTTDTDKYEIIKAGAEWILKDKETTSRFMQDSKNVKNLYALCSGRLSENIKNEILFFISVRSFITKIEGNEKVDISEINNNVAKMLENAIQDDEMMEIGKINASKVTELLSNDVLEKLSKMKEKNIAVEVMKRALKGYINNVARTNMVVSQKFSEKFNKIVDAYNQRVTNEDIEKVIQSLIDLKNEIQKEIDEGNEYDLSLEEKAFFDVLGDDPDIKSLMEDETLVKIAKELVKTVNQNMTVDWDIRKDSRAKMRIEIKKLLIKYDYPPVKREKAVENVIRQAELECKNNIYEGNFNNSDYDESEEYNVAEDTTNYKS